MYSLIVLSCFVVVAIATPIEVSEPKPFLSSHETEIDGSYTFSYASEDSSKTETRSPSGSISGAFSYVDDNGVVQKYQYIAGEEGFQVTGTGLPVGSTVQVQATPEVLEATAEHNALVQAHLKKVVLAEQLEVAYRAAHPELFKEVRLVKAPVSALRVPIRIFNAPKKVEFSDVIPVAPEEDDEVKIARAQHLATVEKLIAEHFTAVAAAPKLEE